MQVLYRTIAQEAQLRSTDTVLDLYCGAGSIGLALAAQCAQVVGYEVSGELRSPVWQESGTALGWPWRRSAPRWWATRCRVSSGDHLAYVADKRACSGCKVRPGDGLWGVEPRKGGPASLQRHITLQSHAICLQLYLPTTTHHHICCRRCGRGRGSKRGSE